jgi:ribulose-5-phosphate 4-epimerase/fuculose-1-phosphate aldolase
MAMQKINRLLLKHKDAFLKVEKEYQFGTIAVRISDSDSFHTTGRGKKEISDITTVLVVDHANKVVYPIENKATLNAPLLHRIFTENKSVDHILHFHTVLPNAPTFPYAPPGTVRDTMTPKVNKSFNVKGHGCYMLVDSNNNVI